MRYFLLNDFMKERIIVPDFAQLLSENISQGENSFSFGKFETEAMLGQIVIPYFLNKEGWPNIGISNLEVDFNSDYAVVGFSLRVGPLLKPHISYLLGNNDTIDGALTINNLQVKGVPFTSIISDKFDEFAANPNQSIVESLNGNGVFIKSLYANVENCHVSGYVIPKK